MQATPGHAGGLGACEMNWWELKQDFLQTNYPSCCVNNNVKAP